MGIMNSKRKLSDQSLAKMFVMVGIAGSKIKHKPKGKNDGQGFFVLFIETMMRQFCYYF